MNTKMTELLGIQHPIMQGGMQHFAVPKLAAAVSNAGGLGTINSTIYPEPELLRAAIRETRSMTEKPFCVNISMLPEANAGDQTAKYFEICAEEGVAAIESAGRNPVEYLPIIAGTGIKLIHKVPSVKLAKKAEQIGADMVSVVGLEAAGHPGMDEVGTFVLGNLAARSVSIPVILGGGVADGRSMAAALALGAQGVVMGTAMLLSEESPLHGDIKAALTQAGEKDTILIQKSIRNMLRAFKNQRSTRVWEVENAYHPTFKELFPLISGSATKEALTAGDAQAAIIALGQSVGLVDEVVPVAELVERVMADAQEEIRRLGALL